MITNFSKALLLLSVCAQAVGGKLLRSMVKEDVGTLTTEAVRDRTLTRDTNIDDYAHLELFNELPFVTVTAPSVSELTGEKTITIQWTEVSATFEPTASPTSLAPTTLQPSSLEPSASPTAEPTKNRTPKPSPITGSPSDIPTRKPFASPIVQLQQNSYQSKNPGISKGKNKDSSFRSKKTSTAPSTETVSPTPAPFSYNGVGMSYQDVASVDLPPISMSLNTKYQNGEVDTAELSSLFSDFLLDYLRMELPARYDVIDVSLVTNYFMENSTVHECFVIGQLDLVNSEDLDFAVLDELISLTLLRLFTENDFVEVLQNAEDEILKSTTKAKLALLKVIEKEISVSAVVQQERDDEGKNDNVYFFIACGGFGIAILLLGYSICYSSRRKRARRSRRKQRRAYRGRRDYSPGSNCSSDSYDDPETCGVSVMDFVVEACSSFLTKDSGQESVLTHDVHNNCSFGSFWEPTRSRARSSSMPPHRRPYPYPATQSPSNGRGHVRRNSQPSDMSLAMKSQNMSAGAGVREEWTCVDGVVRKKVNTGVR
ncbi:hypothetical protein ACHAWO_000847 [Cyclotella atomus]|uniref:Uncharacterized protein n=1 Tax=Cyclotella atomus TaxID=382360 RepID=A0ABD3MZ83_9STRA